MTTRARNWADASPLGPVLRAVTRFPMISFFAIALIVQAALVSAQFYQVSILGLGFFRVYAPAIIAVMVAAVAFGRGPAWKLISSLGAWRAHPRFYAFAVFYPPAVALASVLLLRAVGLKDSLELDYHEIATARFFRLTITVSIVEEIAWIGFGLMVMRRLLSLFSAAIVVGACWGIWYIPLVLTEMQVAPQLPILPLILNFMTIGAICAWLYYRTHSALLVAIMQVTTNYTSQLIPVLPLRGGTTQYVLFVILKSLFMLSLFLMWGPRPLFARARCGDRAHQ